MPEHTPQIHLSIPQGGTSAPSSPTSPAPQRYKPIRRSESDVRMETLSPQQLEALLSPPGSDGPPPHILVVDVRPWNMYAYTHIASAISICIPSTLMKRPTFGFERMLEFVSPQDVSRLRALGSASHIVFYDQGTTRNLPDSSLRRTAAKFLSAAPSPQGKLYWLVGGLLAVSQEVPSLIEAGDDLMEMVSDESDEDSDNSWPDAVSDDVQVDSSVQAHAAASAELLNDLRTDAQLNLPELSASAAIFAAYKAGTSNAPPASNGPPASSA